jgi:hypothetical protein
METTTTMGCNARKTNKLTKLPLFWKVKDAGV